MEFGVKGRILGSILHAGEVPGHQDHIRIGTGNGVISQIGILTEDEFRDFICQAIKAGFGPQQVQDNGLGVEAAKLISQQMQLGNRVDAIASRLTAVEAFVQRSTAAERH